jgi:hypothetical protein
MVFEILFKKFNKYYEKIFYNYGIFVSKYPICIILVSLSLNIFLSIGILKINMIEDTDKLFMLENSDAKKNEKFLKNLFNNTEITSNEFYLHQIFDFGTGAEINFKVRGNSSSNILEKKYLDEIQAVHFMIYENVEIKVENETYKFKDLCAQRNEICWVEGSALLNVEFLKYLKEKSIELQKTSVEDSLQVSFEENLYINYNGSLTHMGLILGKDFKYNLGQKINQSYAYSSILKLRYQLKYNYDTTDIKAKLWELEFLKFVKTLNTSLVSFTYTTSKSLEDEMNGNIKLDSVLVSVTFILITIFATIFMSINSNKITSPGLILPSAGIFSAMFGITSSIGTLSYFGYPACVLIFVIPFLVMGMTLFFNLLFHGTQKPRDKLLIIPNLIFSIRAFYLVQIRLG